VFGIDTIDLQDKNSPTAQDHSNAPHPAPLGVGPAAPHQQATLRQVEDDRATEEKGTWDNNGLGDDPDEGDVVDNAAIRLSGNSGEGDDAEVADGEDDDYDDMDRISSSPSISDGGYSLPSYSQSRQERSSASLESSPLTSSSTTYGSSSPFTDTPVHLPFAVAAARRLRVPAGGTSVKSPSSSPVPRKIHSAVHHHGEYPGSRTTKGAAMEATPRQNRIVSPRTQHLSEVESRLQNLRLDSDISLMSGLDDETVHAMLQPLPRNLEDPFTDTIKRSSTPPPKTKEEVMTIERTSTSSSDTSHDEEDSWTTDSDADSFDEDLDQDDDTKDISFSEDPRFLDTGWGPECLQYAESIDFDSVYALHTFVATVEGQANATKGVCCIRFIS
jgi:hypothetical protein